MATKTPTAPQLFLLSYAHANNGRLPSGSFAYYGMFRRFGGAEKIQAALRAAAYTADDDAAAARLCDARDYDQMLMAGGCLGVERRNGEGARTLADRYVTAIRRSRIRSAGKPITPGTLNACIKAGWFDDRWQLTDAGLAAGMAADPFSFRPRYELPWRDACYRRAVQIDAARPDMSQAAAQLVDEAHEQANAMAIVRDLYADDIDRSGLIAEQAARAEQDTSALLGAGSLGRLPASGKTSIAMGFVRQALEAGEEVFLVDPKTEAQAPGWATTLLDGERWRSHHLPDRSVDLAMQGRKGDDLILPEIAAVARGVPVAVARRLMPAAAGATMDHLLPQVTAIRDQIVALMPAGREAVAGDPAGAGYRLAVHEARCAAATEKLRGALFHYQIALNRIFDGKEGTAMISLRKAQSVLNQA